MNETIVFFDGVCALCNGAVRFIIDRNKSLRFAPLQGETAQRLLGDDPARTELTSLIVRTDSGEVLRNSPAIFYIASRLGFPWRAVAWARVLPRFITDAVYRLVTRTRYKIFGRYDECRLPAPDERNRILD